MEIGRGNTRFTGWQQALHHAIRPNQSRWPRVPDAEQIASALDRAQLCQRQKLTLKLLRVGIKVGNGEQPFRSARCRCGKSASIAQLVANGHTNGSKLGSAVTRGGTRLQSADG